MKKAKTKYLAPEAVLEVMGLRHQSAYRKQKRAAIRRVVREVDDLRRGAAYMPGYKEHLEPLLRHLEELKRLASVKEWGR